MKGWYRDDLKHQKRKKQGVITQQTCTQNYMTPSLYPCLIYIINTLPMNKDIGMVSCSFVCMSCVYISWFIHGSQPTWLPAQCRRPVSCMRSFLPSARVSLYEMAPHSLPSPALHRGKKPWLGLQHTPSILYSCVVCCKCTQVQGGVHAGGGATHWIMSELINTYKHLFSSAAPPPWINFFELLVKCMQ